MPATSDIQQEVNALILKLRKVSDNAKARSQSAFKEAAGPLVSAIQGRAPVSEEQHYRYSTAKLSGKIRAPKGAGNIVATYQPGNVQRSFRVLTFRRSAAVFIGPKAHKSDTGGLFAGKRVDPYYAHFVEFGTKNIPATPFVRPAVAAAGPQVLRFAAELLKREILKTTKQ